MVRDDKRDDKRTLQNWEMVSYPRNWKAPDEDIGFKIWACKIQPNNRGMCCIQGTSVPP